MLQQLVRWFEENQRPLPWRSSYDPYHVWVSEVMLQQTQVETALPYYERFILEFPDVEALAKAAEERVLTLWAGLGYYRRAKNLMAAARAVVAKHGGRIPTDYDSLIELPGVGVPRWVREAVATECELAVGSKNRPLRTALGPDSAVNLIATCPLTAHCR